MLYPNQSTNHIEPWNKGKLIGQKPPLKLQQIWSIRVRLQIANHLRNLALFNLAIDSKLRSCDLVKLKVRDIALGVDILKRAIVMQQKTSTPVQFDCSNTIFIRIHRTFSKKVQDYSRTLTPPVEK